MGTKFASKKRVNSAHPVGSVEYSLKTDHGPLTTVYDKTNDISFVLDTGAVVSLIPPLQAKNYEPYSGPQNLIAVNGSPVHILGVKPLNVDLNKRAQYPWTFKVADISCAILGSDFLSFYGLKIDSSCGRLIESQKNIEPRQTSQTKGDMNSSPKTKSEFKTVPNTLPSYKKPTIPENSNSRKDSNFSESKFDKIATKFQNTNESVSRTKLTSK